MVLVFPGSDPWELLLLSEREADGLMEQLWPSGGRQAPPAAGAGPQPMLLSFALLRAACQDRCDGNTGASPRLVVRAPNEPSPASTLGLCKLEKTFPELVSVQLFNGDTTFSAQADATWEQVRATPLGKEIHRMVQHKKQVVEALVAMHGKQTLLAYSHLEQACD